MAGDAHVNSLLPGANFGALSNLYVGKNNTALLKFDLSSLPSGVTSSQIANAKLVLFVNRVNTAGTVNVLPVNGEWDENSVTSLPALGAPVANFRVSQAGQYVVIDLTSQVKDWIGNPGSHYGFALSSDGAYVLLDSKENDQTAHAAKLDVTITSMGAQGPAGPQGIQGPVGATGAIGPIGPVGPAGPAGAIGPAGPQGIQGPEGATGPAGPTGAQGAQGPPVTFQGAWSSGVTYAHGDVVAENGTSYIALQVNTGDDPATDVASSGGKWAVLAQRGDVGPTGLQGPAGPQGIQGIQGVAGPAGQTGASGATGPTGPTGAAGPIGPPVTFKGAWSSGTTYVPGDAVAENGTSYIALLVNTGNDPATDVASSGGKWAVLAQKGLDGVSPTFSVGSVTTGLPNTAANVTISGPASARVLDFTIPQGLPGAMGPQGEKGDPGANGTGVTTPWSASATYSTGALVAYNNALFMALQDVAAGVTPGSGAALGKWAGVALGTGNNPAGIPYTVGTHGLATSGTTYYTSPIASNVNSNVTLFTTAYAPTACIPSMTVYSLGPTGGTFSLYYVQPTSGGASGVYWSTTGGSIFSCDVAASSGGNPEHCSATASGPITAGSFLTISTPIQTSANMTTTNAGAYIAFSCY